MRDLSANIKTSEIVTASSLNLSWTHSVSSMADDNALLLNLVTKDDGITWSRRNL